MEVKNGGSTHQQKLTATKVKSEVKKMAEQKPFRSLQGKFHKPYPSKDLHSGKQMDKIPSHIDSELKHMVRCIYDDCFRDVWGPPFSIEENVQEFIQDCKNLNLDEKICLSTETQMKLSQDIHTAIRTYLRHILTSRGWQQGKMCPMKILEDKISEETRRILLGHPRTPEESPGSKPISVKVCDVKRSVLVGLAAETLGELELKIQEFNIQRHNLPGSKDKFEVVLEEDGTVIDNEYFQSLEEDTKLMVIGKGQPWTSAPPPEGFGLVEVDGQTSSASHDLSTIADRIAQNITVIAFLSKDDLKLVVEADISELQGTLRQSMDDTTFIHDACERRLREIIRSQEASDLLHSLTQAKEGPEKTGEEEPDMAAKSADTGIDQSSQMEATDTSSPTEATIQSSPTQAVDQSSQMEIDDTSSPTRAARPVTSHPVTTEEVETKTMDGDKPQTSTGIHPGKRDLPVATLPIKLDRRVRHLVHDLVLGLRHAKRINARIDWRIHSHLLDLSPGALERFRTEFVIESLLKFKPYPHDMHSRRFHVWHHKSRHTKPISVKVYEGERGDPVQLAAKTLEELKSKIRQHNLPGSKGKFEVVLEEDGTVIDDDIFQSLEEDTKLMVIGEEHSWESGGKCKFEVLEEDCTGIDDEDFQSLVEDTKLMFTGEEFLGTSGGKCKFEVLEEDCTGIDDEDFQSLEEDTKLMVTGEEFLGTSVYQQVSRQKMMEIAGEARLQQQETPEESPDTKPISVKVYTFVKGAPVKLAARTLNELRREIRWHGLSGGEDEFEVVLEEDCTAIDDEDFQSLEEDTKLMVTGEEFLGTSVYEQYTRRKLMKIAREAWLRQHETPEERPDTKPISVKVYDVKRGAPVGLAAETLDKLRWKIRQHDLPGSKGMFEVVLEEDCTVIDDEYFQSLEEDTKLMVIGEGHPWTSEGGMVEVDGQPPSHLATVVRRINQDMKVLPFLSKADLELLAEADINELQVLLRQSKATAAAVQENCDQLLFAMMEAQNHYDFLNVWKDAKQAKEAKDKLASQAGTCTC